MKSPLISLVIPMHNAEKYITECLNSAIQQTYTNLEIVIIDDSSTDKSASIVSGYIGKHTNITLEAVNNGNASLTRRDGVKKSKGDLICFLDADDVLDKHYIERLYQAAETTNTDVAACYIETFSGVFKPIKSPSRTKAHTIDSNAHSFANHYHITDTNKLTLQTLPGKLFKKDLFGDIDYSILKTNIFEDNFIMVQVLQKVKKVSVIDEILYWYRQTTSSTSSGTIFTQVEYDGRKLNSIEFFKDVVMEYCRRMLQGSNVDAEIDRLCAAEFFNYARIVPDLILHKEYLEQKIALEETQLKDKEAQIGIKNARIEAILNSKSYRLGNALVWPVSKGMSHLRGRK